MFDGSEVRFDGGSGRRTSSFVDEFFVGVVIFQTESYWIFKSFRGHCIWNLWTCHFQSELPTAIEVWHAHRGRQQPHSSLVRRQLFQTASSHALSQSFQQAPDPNGSLMSPWWENKKCRSRVRRTPRTPVMCGDPSAIR